MKTDNVQEWPRDGAYLTFKAGKEHFAIDIRWVQEIVGFHKLTCPQKGVHTPLHAIKLRGKDVPAVDIRLLCRGRISNTPQTAIIVLRNHGTTHAANKAVLVTDDVGSVVCLKMDDVSKNISYIQNSDVTAYVDGIAEINRVPHYLFNVVQVFNRFAHVSATGTDTTSNKKVEIQTA